MNKTLVGILVILVVVAGGWFVLKDSAPVNTGTGPIKIGFIAPLTGDADVYGEPVRNGAQLAVEEINRAGGINGRPIEMVYEDGKCNGKDAAGAARKLTSIDKVGYIVGGVCSAEAFGFEPIITEAKTFVLMPGASAPKLAGLSPYLMRNNPNDNITGVAIANFLGKSYKKPAIIAEKTDYAQGIKDVFLAHAKQNGLSVVSTQDYDTNTSDFRTVLTQIKNANPDVVWIDAQTSANLIRIGTQARQLGIQAPFITAPFNDQSLIDTGALLDGLITATPPGLATEGKGAQFVEAYTKAYDAPPEYSFYAGAAYDGVYLIAQAIENVGDNPAKVSGYIHSIPSYTGTIGTYHFEESGDVVGIDPVFQKLTGGKFVNL